jgi:Reverse transcriptase (RNA-dependent DNA polymerase)
LDNVTYATKRVRNARKFPYPAFTTDELIYYANAIMNVQPRHVNLDYTDAMASNDAHLWRLAVKDELVGMRKLGTFDTPEIVGNDVQLITTKMLLTHKIEENRRKARLVARGFDQIFGENFWDTASPVLKSSILRTLFGIAASRKLSVKRFDIGQAFLNSNLDTDTLFIEVAQAYIDVFGLTPEIQKAIKDGKRIGLRLRKSLYGLKQAGLMWYRRIRELLLQQSFKVSDYDPCLFFKHVDGEILTVGVYVDDLIVMGKLKQITIVESTLKLILTVNERPITSFLGYEIVMHEGNITLKHTGYIDNMLLKFNIPNAKPILTPLEKNLKLYGPKEDNESVLPARYPYRELIGTLNYLSITTRPDISFAVSSLSRYLDSPTLRHWQAGLRVARYLKGTRELGITFKPTTTINLNLYVDASFNVDKNGRGQNGYVVLLNDAPVTWRSRRQTVTSLSSSEAEMDACSYGVVELENIMAILEELLIPIHVMYKIPILRTDSTTLIKQLRKRDRKFGNRSVNPKFRYLCDTFSNEVFTLEHVNTVDQIADIFTKPLGGTNFIHLRKSLLQGTSYRFKQQIKYDYSLFDA